MIDQRGEGLHAPSQPRLAVDPNVLDMGQEGALDFRAMLFLNPAAAANIRAPLD